MKFLKTMSDPWIPNPCETPSIESVQHGWWDDPATWSAGRIPNVGDKVLISHSVSIRNEDATSDDILVDANGSLDFLTTENTKLEVITLVVLGRLLIGYESNPVDFGKSATIVFRDSPIDTRVDPGQYLHGLLALHNAEVSIHGRKIENTFTRSRTELKSGESIVSTDSPVGDWKLGDRVVVPDTRHFNDTEKRASQQGIADAQWEERILPLTLVSRSGCKVVDLVLVKPERSLLVD